MATKIIINGNTTIDDFARNNRGQIRSPVYNKYFVEPYDEAVSYDPWMAGPGPSDDEKMEMAIQEAMARAYA